MKPIFYIVLMLSLSLTAQERYLTRTGVINFEASVPSFEEVAAKNKTTTAILNSKNGEFAALVLVKGFRFKNALMEEHFNENYAESNLFSKSNFKGKIKGFSIDDLSKNQEKINIDGSLTFHGKEKQLHNLPAEISKKDEIIILKGSFIVKASDFDIKIPKIVRNKIAEEVKVSFEFILKKKG